MSSESTFSEIGLFEAISTLRSIRRFKPDPVPQEMVRRVIEAAIKAPSASNVQPWRFIIVRDQQTRAKLEVYYRDAWEHAMASRAQREGAGASPAPRASGPDFITTLFQAPVLILVCLCRSEVRPLREVERTPVGLASVYPAVQNLLLAARGLGLGTTLTTMHWYREAEVKALLGIPDDVDTVALIPLGYPRDKFGPTRRRPVEEVTYYDHWGNASFAVDLSNATG